MKSTSVISLEKVDHAGYKIFFKNGVFLGDLLIKEDGFYGFWPELRGGYWDSYVLREIADTLDELNAPWQKEIEKYFAEQEKEEGIR